MLGIWQELGISHYTRTYVNSWEQPGLPQFWVCVKTWAWGSWGFACESHCIPVSLSIWRAWGGVSWMTLLRVRFSCMSSIFMWAYRCWKPQFLLTERLPKELSHTFPNNLLVIKVVSFLFGLYIKYYNEINAIQLFFLKAWNSLFQRNWKTKSSLCLFRFKFCPTAVPGICHFLNFMPKPSHLHDKITWQA